MKLPSPLLASAVLAVALAMTLPSGTLAQTCPKTCIETPNSTPCTSNPTGTASGTTFDGTGTGSYDLALGTARARSSYFGWAIVRAADQYVITGPPDDTPVAITARLVLSGGLYRECAYWDGVLIECAHAGASMTIADSAGSSLSYGTPDRYNGSVSHTLDLLLTKNAGQPFRLDWSVGGGSNLDSGWNIHGSTDVTATLLFLVPPGVTISSCNGYVGNVVGAQPASWGALKLRYR